MKIVKEEQQEAKKARLKRIFEENSFINPSLKEATFENFESNEFRQALQKAKRYVEEFDLKNPKNLFFQGSFGTGKSHLSMSIAKALTEKGYTTIFISTPKLLTKIRNTYNKESGISEEQIINAIADADLVVFDDIGAEGEISGWGMQKLFEVIDQRAGKHNIYTTNLSSIEFEASKDL
ncbi:ATP-binding protein [Bacillus methanolicus]|uniref:ATP-binding protein n=1 Tax=Bacillus methanolicus TaxID=1471 RepID=UPI00163A8BEF|nr:ATP-binding protein [Bacillus methanolicus]